MKSRLNQCASLFTTIQHLTKMKTSIVSIAALVFWGCAAPVQGPKPDAAIEAPVPFAFVERDGVRLPRYDLGQVHPSHQVRPEVPIGEQRLLGEAIIRVVVTPEGKIGVLEIRKSDPRPVIGDSAQKAVAQWHFPIVKQDGVPISYVVDVIVVFAGPDTPML